MFLRNVICPTHMTDDMNPGADEVVAPEEPAMDAPAEETVEEEAPAAEEDAAA